MLEIRLFASLGDDSRMIGIDARVVSMHTSSPSTRQKCVRRRARDWRHRDDSRKHSVVGGLGSAVAEVLAEAGPGWRGSSG